MSVGVLGCMAERLKTQLLEANNVVDIVAGPDSYKVAILFHIISFLLYYTISNSK